MPRRKTDICFGLCPWYGLSPSDSGPKAAPRAEPECIGALTAGHSHRLTSGGKADNRTPHDF
jgi:hypothetical protein